MLRTSERGEQYMRGEGFAFFRWHALKYPLGGCTGWSLEKLCCQLWAEINP